MMDVLEYIVNNKLLWFIFCSVIIAITIGIVILVNKIKRR